MALHPLLDEAADGRLPEWAQITPRRRAHIERVAGLMAQWAGELGLGTAETRRWSAAGYLHDVLREASPDELRPLVPDSLRHVAPKLLHGPAAAERLRGEGVDDEGFLRAIAFHTMGHPALDTIGRALFIADFIEPGRKHKPRRLADLRARMPTALQHVVREVLQARIQRLLKDGRPIRNETAAFWNSLTAAAPEDAGSDAQT